MLTFPSYTHKNIVLETKLGTEYLNRYCNLILLCLFDLLLFSLNKKERLTHIILMISNL